LKYDFYRIATLTKFGVTITKPRTTFFNDFIFNAQVEDFTNTRDSFSVHNVKLRCFKWRSNFVFDNFYSGFITRSLAIASFNLSRSSNVQTNRGVKLQGITSSCCLRISEHHPDLFTKLVDKYNG